MSDIRFTWDQAKNLSDQKKHGGIGFEITAHVFHGYRQVVELSLSFPNPANLPGRNLARDIVPDRENI